jgi:hypothetical protein
MVRKILLIILVGCLTIINSCESNPVEQKATPGRRDYVWTVDTINPGQESLYLGRIWGSSPDDVWAVGSSSWTATSIWHYDGLQWKCDSIPRKINPFAVFGLSSNEVWLGNSNKTIWKFDGTQWLQFGEYVMSGYDMMCLNNFDGLSRSSIYGVGYVELYNANKWKGIIMHYNGISWNFLDVPETKVSFETVAIEPKTGTLVMSGTVYDPSGFIAKVYCWDGNELKELLSGSGWSFVTKLGDEIFATLDSKIYKYADKQLTLWHEYAGMGVNANIICGRSRHDFFVGGVNGITHYNGTDFSTVYETDLMVQRGIIFNKDVFFVGKDYNQGKNYIIRGKLK